MEKMRYFSYKIAAILVILLIVGTGSVWLSHSRKEPLITNGTGLYNGANGTLFHVVELQNKSQRDIKLTGVTVNGGHIPDVAQLGITYDSGHIVQYMGERTDPATTFMELDAAAIHPRLKTKEVQQVIQAKKNTPIHYGVLVKYDKEPVREIFIHYTYMGFAKTLHVDEQWLANDD